MVELPNGHVHGIIPTSLETFRVNYIEGYVLSNPTTIECFINVQCCLFFLFKNRFKTIKTYDLQRGDSVICLDPFIDFYYYEQDGLFD
jgi:hypothetical protein